MSKIGSIASLARRIADGATAAIARGKREFARTDTTMQRIKGEIEARRAMMDKALREKRFRRGK
jgi:hypothetical protein